MICYRRETGAHQRNKLYTDIKYMPNRTQSYDAVIIGAGPNGLAAAITLAQAGKRVLVIEARSHVGGGASSEELTLPGFTHDLGSAVHPFGVGSPFLRSLPLERHGLRWVYPPASVAHPLDDGSAAVLERSVRATGTTLGCDAAAYWRLMAPLVRNWNRISPTVVNPLSLPRHLVALARFGLPSALSVWLLARVAFRGAHARALLGGLGAHSFLALEEPFSAAPGLVLGALGHVVGWPIPAGGAQSLADALASYLRELGGEVVTDWRVEHLDELPSARAVLCDVTPQQLVRIAGDRLTTSYQRRLKRFRQGPGIFKLDYALDGPVPWTASACARAATVHVGGTLEELAESERAPYQNIHAERPYVLLAQPTLFDDQRAPQGKHIVWAYCHVPRGSTEDMTGRVEAQIERFAPGFRERIIARSTMNTVAMEAYNANLIGGDISGGLPNWRQLVTRPVVSLNPYRTPTPGLYICSSSTPPGAGVHGMCGYNAAKAALRELG